MVQVYHMRKLPHDEIPIGTKLACIREVSGSGFFVFIKYKYTNVFFLSFESNCISTHA